MTEQKQVKKPSARRRARECTVQALYSWAVSGNTAEQVELAFVLDQDMDGVDKPYFRKLFRQTVENIETVDFSISPYIDRAFDDGNRRGMAFGKLVPKLLGVVFGKPRPIDTGE